MLLRLSLCWVDMRPRLADRPHYLAVNFIYKFITYLPTFSVADWIRIQSSDRTHTELEKMQVEAMVA